MIEFFKGLFVNDYKLFFLVYMTTFHTKCIFLRLLQQGDWLHRLLNLLRIVLGEVTLSRYLSVNYTSAFTDKTHKVLQNKMNSKWIKT